jgi:hypothetical protein
MRWALFSVLSRRLATCSDLPVGTQVKSQEESRRLRSVLARIQAALDSFECSLSLREDAGQRGEEQAGGGASGGLPLPAPGGKPVETKVASLLSLLQSQQDEIELLRKQLDTSKGAVASPGAKRGLDAFAHNDVVGAPGFLDHGRGASLFLQKKRLHVDGVTDDQSEVSMPPAHRLHLFRVCVCVHACGTGPANTDGRTPSREPHMSAALSAWHSAPVWDRAAARQKGAFCRTAALSRSRQQAGRPVPQQPQPVCVAWGSLGVWPHVTFGAANGRWCKQESTPRYHAGALDLEAAAHKVRPLVVCCMCCMPYMSCMRLPLAVRYLARATRAHHQIWQRLGQDRVGRWRWECVHAHPRADALVRARRNRRRTGTMWCTEEAN